MSEKYERRQIVVQCENNHTWKTNFSSLKSQNTGCPYCKGVKVWNPIKTAQKIAKKYNGECLSTSYINYDTKLKWKCEEGHIWETILYNVKNRNYWCSICSKSRSENNIRDVLEQYFDIIFPSQKPRWLKICNPYFYCLLVNYHNLRHNNFHCYYAYFCYYYSFHFLY